LRQREERLQCFEQRFRAEQWHERNAHESDDEDDE
jgi:hypothetical protein